MNITVTLPWPDARLSPNATARHWRAKAAPQSEAHKAAFMLTRSVMAANGDVTISRKMRLAIIVTYHPPNAARRDWDNVVASLKHSFDGVADALDYDDAQIDVALTVRGKPKRGGEVVINILSVDRLKYSVV